MKYIKVSRENNIGRITLNRPESLNALNYDLIQEIGEVMADFQGDKDIYGVIITGEGEKAFAAGADIKGFPELDGEMGKSLSLAGHQVFNAVENFSKPVIAAVNGYALGGGLELAMCCHMRIATENAVFGMPETKLGLIPGYGGTQRLVHLIGKAKAMEYILTADMIDAPTAVHLGLINEVVLSGKLLERAEDILEKISRRGPLAVSKAIQAVNAATNPKKDGFQMEIESFGELMVSDQCKEGVAAFIEKRAPNFR